MTTPYRITLLPGDGIGPEVIAEAVKVLRAIEERIGPTFEFETALAGGAAIDATGSPLPAETLRMCRSAHAVLLGAVGGPKWDSVPHEQRPEAGLLALRKGLGVYANLRPARVLDVMVPLSALKPERVRGTDLLIVRELEGGIYFGKPRGIKTRGGVRVGINTEIYSEPEIERVAHRAFKLAEGRRRLVTSVDKANILESSRLWREVVERVAKSYPDVKLNHLYVDSCAMALIERPKSFDVILTNNIFGDILSDEAAVLTGSIGFLPSASLGEQHALYEPVHGSAPDIAGQNRANPLAAILSVAMMLRHSFEMETEARAIETAVENLLEQGVRTADIPGRGRALGTKALGDRVAAEVVRLLTAGKKAKARQR